MNDQTTMPEPTPDPQLSAALAELQGEPPLEEVEWERLRGSIRARAAIPLARRRRAARAGRWLRPLVPLTAAASMALATWLGVRSAEEGKGEMAEAGASVEEVLHAELSEQEFRLLVSGRADPEALLRLAIDDS